MTGAGWAGEIAFVSGGSRGIGRAVALALAEAGTDVAVHGRDEAALAGVVSEVLALGRRAAAFTADLRDEAALRALPARVEAALGPVDLLVNNAGVAVSAPFLKTDRATWDSILDVNLTSVYILSQAFLPGMLAKGAGRIVNVASVAGKVGHAYVTAYCASKHAVVGFTKALALEVARKGVTVNAVCPSYVETEMTETSIRNIVEKTGRSEEDARESLLAQNPQHRLVSADEVAACVRYLCSDAARGVNGQAINLCGGATPL